ncbi:uncharacterized protein LOC143460678 isoform X1 [Clavelina lepadiformis]|uniref:uncharacterized protein LOC143460678 isoform X1 n=1 Tax=Clavelina lepadiformis TaxID=159417 RepID=UPI0040414912
MAYFSYWSPLLLIIVASKLIFWTVYCCLRFKQKPVAVYGTIHDDNPDDTGILETLPLSLTHIFISERQRPLNRRSTSQPSHAAVPLPKYSSLPPAVIPACDAPPNRK